MSSRALLAITLLTLPALGSPADPFETLREGVLGVPWGATLDDVVALYPNGDHVFATTSGHRAYWVKEGQTFLGIPRERNGVLYGMNENNRLVVVAVAFEYEYKEQLLQTLVSLFGLPDKDVGKDSISYAWESNGRLVGVREFGKPHQRIVWLSIAAPGYENRKEKCP